MVPLPFLRSPVQTAFADRFTFTSCQAINRLAHNQRKKPTLSFVVLKANMQTAGSDPIPESGCSAKDAEKQFRVRQRSTTMISHHFNHLQYFPLPMWAYVALLAVLGFIAILVQIGLIRYVYARLGIKPMT